MKLRELVKVVEAVEVDTYLCIGTKIVSLCHPYGNLDDWREYGDLFVENIYVAEDYIEITLEGEWN